MDDAPSFNPFTGFFFFFFSFSFVVAQAAFDSVVRETLPSPAPPSPSQNPGDDGGRGTPFKPSVIVIVGVLTTLFSLTFLLLLYVRHCKPGDENSGNSNRGRGGGGHGSLVRKNSGIERVVIESLPIFRFGSLRGEKDGLECAVCLTPFEPVEVLRLLPKCRHAFHVECVDTWLDAHSTCPLCRHRVDPEDILLLEDAKVWPQNQPIPEISDKTDLEIGSPEVVPGRVSSVEERGGFLPIIMQQKDTTTSTTASTSSTPVKKSMIPFRRSLDSAMISSKIKRKEREGSSISCGGDGGARKDGLLLLTTEKENKHRLSHQIIVSPSPKHKPVHQRWSDVQPSDLLYLTSEMILTSEDNSRRLSSSSSSRPSLSQQQNMQLPLYRSIVRENANRRELENRRGRMSLRSVSEITGLSRNQEQEQEEGVASRWRAWISQTQRNVR